MQETYYPAREKNYQSQERMSRPPACITTKDLAYLRDALSWELLAMKKCYHYAQHCQNEKIRKTINTAGQIHQRHYRMLLVHLNQSTKEYIY
ncbi:MAG: hypothetical protein ACOC2J_01565 [bacterium]